MNAYDKLKINTLINETLDALKKDRDREVLRRRGGIDTESQTLEQIGKDLNITRERVRQIEKAAMARLREKSDHNHDLTKNVNILINKRGGLISLNELKRELGITKDTEPHIVFLVKVNPNFIYAERADSFGQLVSKAGGMDEAQIEKLHLSLVDAVKEHGKPSKLATIHKFIDGPHKQDTLAELAKASSQLAELDGLWGLKVWPEVNPKSIRDKIYLILKKTGRPLHFTDISDRISALAANPKKVTTQAVHNELIKDDRFVLIGRGIYALGEWGYRSGTVADIIEDILREENGPLNKEEIIKRVLSRRQVKTTTIILNLQEKPQFKRVDKGIYALALS
jgi:hypothetical protein